tara:strand:- start:683 stop:973 length:291 start_codon:yes stop_codon:yes gene_type:complete
MKTALTIELSLSHRMIAILWPSFACAIFASGLFFSAFRPQDLMPFDLAHEYSSVAVYSIGFLTFWLIAALSSGSTLYLAITNSGASRQSSSAGGAE